MCIVTARVGKCGGVRRFMACNAQYEDSWYGLSPDTVFPGSFGKNL